MILKWFSNKKNIFFFNYFHIKKLKFDPDLIFRRISGLSNINPVQTDLIRVTRVINNRFQSLILTTIWNLGFGIWDLGFRQNAETIFRHMSNPKLISTYIGFGTQV